jgi:hypothetical protein
MAKVRRRYVRQMPKIYGNLQKPPRSYAGLARFVRLLAWIAGLAAVVYGIFLSGFFSVKRIDVQGTSLMPATEVSALAPTGGPIWFFPKEAVTSHLLEDDRVQSVSILKGLPDSIRIVVHERQPALAWVSGTSTTLVDGTGLAFLQYDQSSLPAATTPVGTIITALPHVQDTKSLPVSPGHRILSSGFVSFVQTISQNLGTTLPELTIDHFEVGDTTYNVTLVAKQGMQVQLNALADPGVQSRNLARMVQQKKATLTSKVDLRIDRWAYVQ